MDYLRSFAMFLLGVWFLAGNVSICFIYLRSFILKSCLMKCPVVGSDYSGIRLFFY